MALVSAIFSMTFVGNSLNLEVMELNPKKCTLYRKEISAFFIFFLCVYLFFNSSPHYNTLGFRSIKSKDPVENPSSLWISVNLGATLCRKRAVSQRNKEAAQGITEKKPRFKLIGRISRRIRSGTDSGNDMVLSSLPEISRETSYCVNLF